MGVVSLADVVGFSTALLLCVLILINFYKLRSLSERAVRDLRDVSHRLEVKLTHLVNLRAEVSEEVVSLHKRIDDLDVKKKAKK